MLVVDDSPVDRRVVELLLRAHCGGGGGAAAGEAAPFHGERYRLFWFFAPLLASPPTHDRLLAFPRSSSHRRGQRQEGDGAARPAAGGPGPPHPILSGGGGGGQRTSPITIHCTADEPFDFSSPDIGVFINSERTRSLSPPPLTQSLTRSVVSLFLGEKFNPFTNHH